MEKYTQIENEILEALCNCNLSSAELRVVLFFIRKMNGYHKNQDQISLSQIVNGTELSKQTVCNCLSQLKLVNIIRLVKNGVSAKQSNEWLIERNVSKWKLVNRRRLVKFPIQTSQISGKKLVNISRHTKEIYKRNIQKKEYTKKYFKSHVTEILSEAKKLYPDKNVERTMDEFLEGIEIKDYGYKNYKLAYFKWIRNSQQFNQSNRTTRPKLIIT